MSSPLDRVRHAAGAIMHDGGSQSGWTVVGETLQCVHCGTHWMMQPGSGHERGFCMRCMGPVCGDHECWECVPEEQMLERMEAQGRADVHGAVNDAERVAEQLGIKSDLVVAGLAGQLVTLRSRGVEYRARMDANIKAIRGA